MDTKNLNKLEKWINKFLEIQNVDEVHKKGKYNHSYRTASFAKQLYPDNKLLEVAMKFHDVGRFVQYDRIHSLDDNILSHYKVGKEFISHYYVFKNK